MKRTKWVPLKGDHYLYSGDIYRVKSVSSGTNQIEMIRLMDGSISYTRYDTFQYAFQQVWKIGEVAKFLGRSPRSIYRYESLGQIEKPKRYRVKDRGELRFYTKQDILEMRDLISGIAQGRPRKDKRVTNNTLPTKSDLMRMFKERFNNG